MKLSKLKQQARRHEQREEWEQALQLYQRVLQSKNVAETDLPLFNRAGDLHLRLGRPARAVDLFLQAADRYTDAGLHSNAIALCNKALRHAPERAEIYRRLAECSAAKGLPVEARRWVAEYAERKLRSDGLDKALTALVEVASRMDDPEIRVFLARQLAGHGRTKDAVEQLAMAHAAHLRAGHTPVADKLRDEILALDPDAQLPSADDVQPSDLGLPILEPGTARGLAGMGAAPTGEDGSGTSAPAAPAGDARPQAGPADGEQAEDGDYDEPLPLLEDPAPRGRPGRARTDASVAKAEPEKPEKPEELDELPLLDDVAEPVAAAASSAESPPGEIASDEPEAAAAAEPEQPAPEEAEEPVEEPEEAEEAEELAATAAAEPDVAGEAEPAEELAAAEAEAESGIESAPVEGLQLEYDLAPGEAGPAEAETIEADDGVAAPVEDRVETALPDEVEAAAEPPELEAPAEVRATASDLPPLQALDELQETADAEAPAARDEVQQPEAESAPAEAGPVPAEPEPIAEAETSLAEAEPIAEAEPVGEAEPSLEEAEPIAEAEPSAAATGPAADIEAGFAEAGAAEDPDVLAAGENAVSTGDLLPMGEEGEAPVVQPVPDIELPLTGWAAPLRSEATDAEPAAPADSEDPWAAAFDAADPRASRPADVAPEPPGAAAGMEQEPERDVFHEPPLEPVEIGSGTRTATPAAPPSDADSADDGITMDEPPPAEAVWDDPHDLQVEDGAPGEEGSISFDSELDIPLVDLDDLVREFTTMTGAPFEPPALDLDADAPDMVDDIDLSGLTKSYLEGLAASGQAGVERGTDRPAARAPTKGETSSSQDVPRAAPVTPEAGDPGTVAAGPPAGGAEPEPEQAAGMEAGTGPEPEPRAETVAEPDAPAAETEPVAGPAPPAEAEAAPVAEPEPGTEAVAEPEAPAAEPEPVAEPEPPAEAAPAAEPEPVAEPEPAAEPELVAEPEPDRAAEPEETVAAPAASRAADGAGLESAPADPVEEIPAAAASGAEPQEDAPSGQPPAPATHAITDLQKAVLEAEALAEAGDETHAAELLERLADALMSAGRAADAAVVTARLVRLQPENLRHHQRRVEYAVAGRERALILDAYLDLATCLRQLGDTEKSETILRRVLDIEPHHHGARVALYGEAGAGDFDEEIDQAVDALLEPATAAEEPEPAEPAEPVAGPEAADSAPATAPNEAADPEHEFTLMLADFKSQVARSLEGEDPTNHYDLGVAFREMGLLDEAIAEFQTALRGGVDVVKIYEQLGQCFFLKGQFAVAAQILSRAARMGGKDGGELVGVHYHLGRCYEELGRRSEARQAFTRVVEVDRGFHDAAARLARL